MENKLTKTPFEEKHLQDDTYFKIFKALQQVLSTIKETLNGDDDKLKTLMDEMDETLYELFLHTSTVAEETSEFANLMKEHNKDFQQTLADYQVLMDKFETLGNEKADLIEKIDNLKKLNEILENQHQIMMKRAEVADKEILNLGNRNLDLKNEVDQLREEVGKSKKREKDNADRIGDLEKEKKSQKFLIDKNKNMIVLAETCFQFKKYVAKYLFPDQDPIFVNLKIGRLDELIEDYLTQYVLPEHRDAEIKTIKMKIETLNFDKEVKYDAIIDDLKETRMGIAHVPLVNPKDYPISVVEQLAVNYRAEKKVKPLLDVLKKITPDGLIFTDVEQREWKEKPKK